MVRLRVNGIIFWSFAAYSFAGALSGLLLGGEWLRAENRAGVSHLPMIALSWCLLAAATVIRIAIKKRGSADGLASYFALMSWASLAGAAVWAGVGWLGRLPNADLLWSFHVNMMFVACVVGAKAALDSGRLAVRSKTPAFRFPAAIYALAVLSIIGYSACDAIFGINYDPWGAVATAISIALVALAVAAVRVSFLAPDKKTGESRCQRPQPI